MKKIIFLSIVLFSNLITFAQDSILQTEENTQLALKNSYTPNYFGMFFGLLIVICLVYITAIVYQKLLKVKLTQQNGTNEYNIKIINSIQIGQNQKINIIKVADEYLLIGSTQNNISLLKELKRKD